MLEQHSIAPAIVVLAVGWVSVAVVAPGAIAQAVPLCAPENAIDLMADGLVFPV